MKEIFAEGTTTPFIEKKGTYSETSSDQCKRMNL